ncbi:hypothetical protein NQ318_004865 [Aromia moschata]|uniref:Uncharacterized protein n=1 Tax=Aromia moschata TaxID=1265417 RepID=A0AAV8Z2T7_9CUCU|nr:hypothetical protein NQ318_004865 [Aromia moschata]
MDSKTVSQKQKDVLLLLSHINQEYMYPDWKNIIESYNVSQHSSQYSKPEVVQDFEMYYPHDYLPKGHIFSIMYSEHLHEAIVLFKLFYYATTYETFYNTAVWARYHLNEGLFLYAYSVAVIHRPDMKGAVLPPIYEIYPHYFYDTSAIHKAYYYKQVHSTQHPHSGYNPQHGYTVHGNYSGIT